MRRSRAWTHPDGDDDIGDAVAIEVGDRDALRLRADLFQLDASASARTIVARKRGSWISGA